MPVGFIVWAVIFSASCGGAAEKPAANANNNTTAGRPNANPVAVQTARVEMREVPQFLQATGNFIADESTDVASQVAGQIIKTEVNEGSFVSQGEVLVRLDDRDARLRLNQQIALEEQAAATLKQSQARLGLERGGNFNPLTIPEVLNAQATYEQRQAESRLAFANERRYANLLESGDTSRLTYDQYRTNLETAHAQEKASRQQLATALNSARQNNQSISVAQSALNSSLQQTALARKALADTVIRAPFAGYVSARPASVGEYVSTSTTLVTIVRTNPIKAILEVPETDAARIQSAMRVSATVAAYTERAFAGSVAAINPNLDQTARTLRVEVRFENNENLLKPGMFGTARFLLPGGSPSAFVPRAALIINQNTNSASVYVSETANGETVARVRVVERASGEEGDFVPINSGLQADETVVISNQSELFDGARVIVGQ